MKFHRFLIALSLPVVLGGCPAATIGAAAAGIIVPPLLEAGTDSVESGKALVIERNERRASTRHARYRAEDQMCEAIKAAVAKASDLPTQLALLEMAVDCEERHYPRLLDGDIFTGLEEGEGPRDQRPLSERAAEIMADD